jgi:hypothetical protein
MTVKEDWGYIHEAHKDSPMFKYRLKEWARTKTPHSPVSEDDPRVENDPKPIKYIMVNLKDLLAVQYHVNMPTVWYYVHTMRETLADGKDALYAVPRIRVKKWGDKWILVNGTHRVEAFRYLKYKTVPAVWGW